MFINQTFFFLSCTDSIHWCRLVFCLVWVLLPCGLQRPHTWHSADKFMQKLPIKRLMQSLYDSLDSSSWLGKQPNCGAIWSVVWFCQAVHMAVAAAEIIRSVRLLWCNAVPISVLLLQPKMQTLNDHQIRKSLKSQPSTCRVSLVPWSLLHSFWIHCQGMCAKFRKQ